MTELGPGRSFTWVATGPGVRTTARHRLKDLGGGTRVTRAVEQAGPVGVVLGPFFHRRLSDRYLTAEAEGISGGGSPGMR